jgi:hypothetical protein
VFVQPSSNSPLSSPLSSPLPSPVLPSAARPPRQYRRQAPPLPTAIADHAPVPGWEQAAEALWLPALGRVANALSEALGTLLWLLWLLLRPIVRLVVVSWRWLLAPATPRELRLLAVCSQLVLLCAVWNRLSFGWWV